MVKRNHFFLLDTNTVTYVITGRSEGVRARYLEEEKESRVAISVVTEGEIRYGLAKKPEASRVNSYVLRFLERVTILPWDSAVAGPYGTLRARLQALGALPSPLDLMIAAHAFALGATLVTHDRALKRLKETVAIEDWTTDV